MAEKIAAQESTLAYSPNENSIDAAAQSLFDSLASDPEFQEETTESVDESQVSEEEEQETDTESESEDFEEEDGIEDDDEGEEDVDDELEDEEDADEDDPSQELHEFKANGEIKKVPYDELLRLASAGVNYTQKTQALSQDKEQIDSLKSEAQQARDRYLAGLQQLEQALAPQEPDWDKLRQELSPADFAAQFADFQRQQQDYQKVQQHRVQEQQKREQEILDRERKALAEAIPEWQDPEVQKQELGELHSYAKNLGYTDQELGQVYDHRVLLMLRDAKRYRDLKAKGTEATKGKKKAPKTLKPGARKTTTKKSASKKRVRAAQKRLENSGRAEDAAALFLETLDLD